jgi:hypothetical protein
MTDLFTFIESVKKWPNYQVAFESLKVKIGAIENTGIVKTLLKH